MDFVAIDVETANPNRRSICSVGLALVQSGCITKTWSSYVSPSPAWFHSRNIEIHGIRKEDVRDAPAFPVVWENILNFANGLPFVAHNARFDRSAISKCMKNYDLPAYLSQWHCTYLLAKSHYPHWKNHKLNTAAAFFNIPLNHHEALSDAIASAEIAIRLLSIEDREPKHYTLGEPKERSDHNVNDLSSSDAFHLPAPNDCAQLNNLRFVFTGDTVMSRPRAEELVKQLGARVTSAVSGKTDFVVVGNYLLKSDQTTGKLSKARDLNEKNGKPIILTETEFLALLKSETIIGEETQARKKESPVHDLPF